MTKSEDVNLSPGKVIILWRLLFFISQNEGVRIQEILGLISDTGIMGGTIPIEDAVRLAGYCRLLKIENERVYLTNEARNEILLLCSSVSPNLEVTRSIVQRILSATVDKCSWLVFFDPDADLFRTSIPDDWLEVLEAAELFEFDDSAVAQWWSEVLNIVDEFDSSRKKEIGDVGEILTIAFEKRRLQSEQVQNAQFLVRWIAKLGNNYGYDVLSMFGKLLNNNVNESRKIQIEAKSSVLDSEDSFRFRVTKNEYKVAMNNIDTYFFYCWIGVDVPTKTGKGPYIIPASVLSPFFPQDTSVFCEWTECRFVFDLTKYSVP
jgi:hypothetical protein